MRARNARYRRARKGRYFLRDLAGGRYQVFARHRNLGKRHAYETPTDVIARSGLFDHSRKAACEGGGEQSLCTEQPYLMTSRDRSTAPWPSVGLLYGPLLFFLFKQQRFAIPYDPVLKCVDGTIPANLSSLAVALHQFERACATSHLEAKMIRAYPNYSFLFHADQPFF